MFFFVVGTVPAIALLVAAVLPLAAALMTLFDRDGATESSAERPDAQLDAATRRASVGAFARFLVIVALFTFVASLTKGMFALQDAQASLASGELGVSLVILVSFGLVLLSSLRSSFNFGAFYYPLVLMLAVALVIAFSSSVGSEPAAAVIVLVYCLFSLFMWCLLAYLARSDYWSPVQVFGWGRSVFALGSLAGLVTGSATRSWASPTRRRWWWGSSSRSCWWRRPCSSSAKATCARSSTPGGWRPIELSRKPMRQLRRSRHLRPTCRRTPLWTGKAWSMPNRSQPIIT